MPKRETYIRRQAKRLSEGQIDRRRFVMSALATGVTMPTAMSLASRAEASVPRYGGHLRFGVPDKTRRANALNAALYDSLTRIDGNGHVRLNLAKSLDTDDGGRTWHLALRDDVTFHSGAPLRADDVIWSLTRADMAGDMIQATDRLIDTIQQDGLARLRLRLRLPYIDFPRILALPDLGIRRLDPARPGVLDGTGPYRVHSSADGAFQLEKNPNDWRPARGYFDEITLIDLPDPKARLSAIMNRDVHLVAGIAPEARAGLAHMPGIALHNTPRARHIAMIFPDHGPLANPDVRGAVKASIHPENLLQAVLLGQGEAPPISTPTNRMARTVPGPLPICVESETPAARAALVQIISDATSKGLNLIETPHSPEAMLLRESGTPDVLRQFLIKTAPGGADTHVPLWIDDVAAHTADLAYAPNAAEGVVQSWWFKDAAT